MDHLIGVVIGFVTFFLFPIAEVIIKKRYSSKDGNPELWYLPSYGFRLVIRNIPRRSKLYNLRYKTLLRRSVKPSRGSSVSTIIETTLVENDDFFLMPGYDQIILCFKLEVHENVSYVIHTDKLGKELNRYPLSEVEQVIANYTAHLDNKFHFDLFVGRRCMLSHKSLVTYMQIVRQNPTERQFQIDDITRIG